jgi:glycosyltransferase involved in cell wall biosynthesis
MDDRRDMTYQIAFVIEDVLGHTTHGDNLRSHVPDDPEVSAHWVTLPFDTASRISHLPGVRSNWTVRSGMLARRELRTIRRAHSLDAVFFHTQVPAMLRPRWVSRIPSVISVDATPRQYDQLGSFYQHGVDPPAIERLKLRVTRARFAEAAHVVAWSAWAKQGLVDEYGVPTEIVSVIPPGVDVNEWSEPPRPDDRPGPVRILFVGGDLERKGGLVLIEAFQSIRDLDVELHLVTRDDVQSAPGIHVHRGLQPNSSELRALYRMADLFALPTFGDCLPMVLSEAGAAALPTISTRVAAIPEVVIDGVTGLLVPPGDVSTLSDAIRRLVTRGDERVQFGSRAASHIAENFDTATNTARLLDVVKHAADGSITRKGAR